MTKVHKSKKLKPDLHHLYGIPEANHLSQDLNALKPCIPVADSFRYMAKPVQYCKVKK